MKNANIYEDGESIITANSASFLKFSTGLATFSKSLVFSFESQILRTLNFMVLRMIGHIGQGPWAINYYFLKAQ